MTRPSPASSARSWTISKIVIAGTLLVPLNPCPAPSPYHLHGSFEQDPGSQNRHLDTLSYALFPSRPVSAYTHLPRPPSAPRQTQFRRFP